MTDSPQVAVPEVPAPDVTRRHDLTVALQAASDAYRESHSFRSPLFAPSGLRSSYRPSEHPVDLPLGFA